MNSYPGPCGCALLAPIVSNVLCGAWHTKGGSVGGRILRNGRAIVLH